MVLPGNALSPVTYKAASNYKLVPMGPTSCVVMSYTINQSKQTATAKYVFDGGTEVPNGEKRVSVVCELIIPTKNGETVIKNKTNGNGEYSRLEKMTKTVALTDAEKAAGYKIQFVDIMNRKLKLIGTAILIATFASTFSACSDTKTDEQARYMRVYGTIYNDGELIVTENAVLSFLQYSDMSTIALCGQSNCDHSNAVTEDGLPCLAYGKQTLPFLYNEKLYWFEDRYETKDGKAVESAVLHSSDPLGTSEKEVCKIEGFSCDWISTSVLKNNTLLFFPYQSAYDEKGAITGDNTNHFGVLDIETGKFTDFGATENNKTKILGVYDNKFYFNSSVYDIKTGKYSENTMPSEPPAVRLSDDYYAYNNDSNIEVLTPKTSEPIVIHNDKILSETVILGDYLFQCDNAQWYYYNLKDEAPARHDISYGEGLYAQVLSEYEDSYIISVYNAEEQTVTKEKVAKSDILGE